MEEERAVAVVAPGDFGVAVIRDPKAVLAEAQRAAKALKDVIASIPEDKKVMMNGEQYLELEHWQVVGTFYNCSAKIVKTEPIEIGGARGFIARAVLINKTTGAEISAAEAICLNDEDKWSTRAKYEWQDGKKTKIGDVPVPMFQLMSMAQTRASAKVHRNVFSWVVVLAGYAPTPAEDMTGDEAGKDKKSISEPKPKAPAGDVLTISFVPVAYYPKEGTKGHAVKSPEGVYYSTLDNAQGETLKSAKEGKLMLSLLYAVNGKYNNVKDAHIIEQGA